MRSCFRHRTKASFVYIQNTSRIINLKLNISSIIWIYQNDSRFREPPACSLRRWTTVTAMASFHLISVAGTGLHSSGLHFCKLAITEVFQPRPEFKHIIHMNIHLTPQPTTCFNRPLHRSHNQLGRSDAKVFTKRCAWASVTAEASKGYKNREAYRERRLHRSWLSFRLWVPTEWSVSTVVPGW